MLPCGTPDLIWNSGEISPLITAWIRLSARFAVEPLKEVPGYSVSLCLGKATCMGDFIEGPAMSTATTQLLFYGTVYPPV